MTISVSEFMTRVARDLNETSNEFLSGAWTTDEMIGYLNYAERDFLHSSGIWQTDVVMTVSAGSSILIDRPDNTMDITRLGFNGKSLHRQTSHDIELEDRDWRSHAVGMPSYYHEDHIPNSKLELNKIPAGGGIVRIFADYLPDPYTTLSENIHLKDCWEPYLRWKVISLALAKDCEDQDLGRSNYSDHRYNMGIMLARRLMKGSAATGIRG